MEKEIYFHKKIYDDVLDSYSIQTYDSGITCLMFNTKYRWIGYHRSSNDTYEFYRELDGEDTEENPYTIEIDGEAGDYLNNISKNIVTQVQEKDQISFYFIPYELITNNVKIKELAIKQRNENKRSSNEKNKNKWKTDKCGRCGEKHENYTGKLDSNGIEYVVCGSIHKRMNVNGVGKRGKFICIFD